MGHSQGEATYPYTRSEECAWHPEEVSRHLSGLLEHATSPGSSSSGQSSLLSRGWSSSHVGNVRRLYGSNVMDGSDSREEGSSSSSSSSRKWRCWEKWGSPCWGPVWSAFASQLKEPLILMLLGSAGLSVVLGNAADAVSIAMALTIVSLVAAVQEYRSEAALEQLAQLIPHTCTVMRDGRVWDHFAAKELVVGDLLLLATGDRVPADCRMVDAVELHLDESSLTGENHPVSKTSQAILYSSTSSSQHGRDPPLTEQTNIVFCGTLVCAGRGRALVVATGMDTEFGKVAQELGQVEARKSPLQVKMDQLGKFLAVASSVVIAVLALLGWCMGRPFLETMNVAVSLAVAAIPEGLPICVTVTLALGVLRMARSNAIVKKLPAVEALGCVTVICSDKTGTLTQNEMTARSAYTLAYPTLSFGLTGVGYTQTTGDSNHGNGQLIRSSTSANTNESNDTHSNKNEIVTKHSMEHTALAALFGVASVCNNATVGSSSVSDTLEERAASTLSGQPTELALLIGAQKAGVPDPRPLYHRLQEVPFTSERKRMEVRARPVSGSHPLTAFVLAAKHQNQQQQQQQKHPPTMTAPRSSPPFSNTDALDGGTTSSGGDYPLYFVKGMPEAVLSECRSHTAADGSAVPLTEQGRWRALSQSRRMAAGGLRVLGMAYGASLTELTFAGLVGMEDPPREGVAEAVLQLRRGGVKVIMVTGDSKETALAIARRCRILGPDHHLHHPHASHTFFDNSSLLPLGHDNDRMDDMDTDNDSSDDVVLTSMLDQPTSHNPLDDLEFGAGLALSGEQLDSIPAHVLSESIMGVRVFYRVAPRHKLSLVRAFQQHDDIVAMTGDGVNDATALKAADIGVAMGKGGTDVAKEAADMILTDDDFSTITKAVAEGKGIFFNIRNFLAFQLSTSFAALLMQTIATAFGLPSPMNAMQILWINIIMDGPPAQSLGVEPVDERILKAQPRKASDPIVTRALLYRAISSAVLIVFLTLKVFSNELDDGQVTRRDTTMTFMMFVNCDLFNAYACRSSERCFYEISFFSNPTFLWAIGGSVFGQLMVIYFPPLQEVFQTEALSVYDLFYIVLLSSSILMLDTLRKKFFASVCTDPIGRMMMKEGKHHKKTDEPANKQGGLNKVSNFFHQRKPMSATKGKRKKRSVRQRNSLTVDI